MNPSPTKRLTALQIDMLAAVLRYRLMTTAQIHRLLYSRREGAGGETSVAKTMRKLHDSGFVKRDWLAVKPTERSILGRPNAIWSLEAPHLKRLAGHLAETGRADLLEELAPDAKAFREGSALAENTLRHELAITDFYMALEMRADESGRTPPTWLRTSPAHPDVSRTVIVTKTDKKTGRQTQAKLPLNPDGLHAVGVPSRGYAFFLLEMDMNTETALEKLTHKFLAYYAYYEQGGFGREIAAPFAQRHALPVARPEAAPFRVLFVAPTAKRRNDLLLKSRVLPTSNLFQFATMADVLADPYGPVWLSKDSFKDHLDEYNLRTNAEGPVTLRAWAHGVLDSLPKHAL